MKHSKFICIACFFLMGFASCSESENDKEIKAKEITDKFIIVNKVGESSYLGTFEGLKNESINNKQAYEHIPGGVIYTYKNMVFYAEALVGDKIHKYIRDQQGELMEDIILNMPSASMPAEISFLNENKAYVSLHGIGKIAIINPTTMKSIGEIDLRDLAIGDNNPDPGVSVVRDGKLFVALNQKKSMISAHLGAHVAIIDTKTDKVIKVISDPRGTAIGMFAHSKVLTDEQGNIYFYSNGMFGYQPDAIEGFLRIKKGELDWDKDFYCSIKELNLPDVPGNKGNYTLSLEYGGKGDVYADIQIPALGTNPPDFVNTRDYQPFKINLFTKTAEKINLPATAGWAAWGITQKDDLVIFALSTSSENGLFTYNKKTGECSKKAVVKTQGIPGYLIHME